MESPDLNVLTDLLLTYEISADVEIILAELKDYYLPIDILPLSKDRQPFKTLSNNAILYSIIYALQFPEKIGRLSLCVRSYLNIPISCPITYVIKEAHFDTTEVDQLLFSELVELGFEPDHFFELNPPDYQWCFTMKFEVPFFEEGNESRLREINKFVLMRSNDAQLLVASHPDCYGYLEVESYSSKNKALYNFKPITSIGLNNFPFEKKFFSQLILPFTKSEATEKNINLNAHKIVDVHVKIPTSHRGYGFEGANSEEMVKLRNLFLDAGFYEIYSEAGNYIYTIQSLDSVIGKKVYSVLTLFATQWGGIAQIKLEICSYFWRKERIIAGMEKLAPIPPLVTLDTVHSKLLENLYKA